MSTTIEAGIRETEEILAAEREIAWVYPEAFLGTLPNGNRVWMCAQVLPTDVQIVVFDGEAYVCTYAKIGRRFVYSVNTGFATVALSLLQRSDSVAYAALVRACES